jgi:hypothetical protein
MSAKAKVPRQSYDIDQLDPTLIGNGAIVVMIGKRGTGKSTLIKDIMYHKRRIPDGVIMSATEDSNEAFAEYSPDSFIYNEYKPAVIKAIIERQKRVNKRRRQQGLPIKYTYVIVDDCAYDDKFLNDKALHQLFLNGRHLGIFFLFSLQYAMKFPSVLRSNTDWVFILRETIPANRKRLYDAFCPVLENARIFDKFMNQVTENYRALVIHQTANSNDIRKCIYWYKARPRPKFQMGSKQFWMKHYQKYNPKWDEPEDEEYSGKPPPRVKYTKENRGRNRLQVRML